MIHNNYRVFRNTVLPCFSWWCHFFLWLLFYFCNAHKFLNMSHKINRRKFWIHLENFLCFSIGWNVVFHNYTTRESDLKAVILFITDFQKGKIPQINSKKFVSKFGENNYFVVFTQHPTKSLIHFWKFSVKNMFDP